MRKVEILHRLLDVAESTSRSVLTTRYTHGICGWDAVGVYLGCKSTVIQVSADDSHAEGWWGAPMQDGPSTALPRNHACISLRTRPAIYRHWTIGTKPSDVRPQLTEASQFVSYQAA